MRKKIFTFLFALAASVGMSWATTTDLASITGDYTAQDGEILTGTLGNNVKISIADGATVTLLNANINGDKTWTTGDYAGLTCLGDATITIVGKNSVSGFSVDNGYPGIYVPSGKTLIINGTGSLTAQSSTEEAAGIGARKNTHCGNIEIQSGKITAIAGGEEGAGIGGGFNGNCGNITISGGIVTAVGGYRGAGIGGGRRSGSTDAGHCGNILISGGVVSATSGEQAAAIGGGRGNNNAYKSNCGTITITTALKVYADQGGSSTNTIGAGKYGNCGIVTIGGNTGVINNDPYTYRTKEDGEIVVDYINAIGTVVYTQECKDKIDIARELYDALEDSQKDLVTNYQTLLDAEAAYAALIPQPGPANPSGTCGDNLTWEFNTETGALTISGTGAMNNYSWDPNAAPWYEYKDAITSVSFPKGITTIGAYAFVNCDNAAFTTVTIPEGVIALGVNAFYNCDGIQEITIPSTVTTIEVGAIYDCKAVNSITSYIASPTNLHGFAIYGYKNTCTLYVPYASIAAYQAADCWNNIPNIAAIPGTEPAPATENSITINGTPQVGDNSISLTYYFDPANVPGICCYAPTLKVKCAADNKWDEIWLSLSEISSGTTTITLEELVSFQEGKSYDVCFAYNNGDWVDEVFQSFTPAAPQPAQQVITWGFDELNTFPAEMHQGESKTIKGITVTVNQGNQSVTSAVGYGNVGFNPNGSNNAFTFSTELGNFTKIECSTLLLHESLGEGWEGATWTGNANSVNFGNVGSYLAVTSITFTIGEAAPQPAEDVDITPNADPENPTVYYSTFFDSENKYALPAGVEAYVAEVSSNALNLTKIAGEGQTIPADNAVILKSTVANFTLAVSDAAPVTFTATNSLRGVDAETTVTDIAGLNTDNCYVLSGGSEDATVTGVGFYLIYGTTLLAHKAYVQYSATSGAPKRMRFVFPQEQMPTGIDETNAADKAQKVIENGTLYIIRDGVRYNAVGQIAQ